jgi:hypothetical protein
VLGLKAGKADECPVSMNDEDLGSVMLSFIASFD